MIDNNIPTWPNAEQLPAGLFGEGQVHEQNKAPGTATEQQQRYILFLAQAAGLDVHQVNGGWSKAGLDAHERGGTVIHFLYQLSADRADRIIRALRKQGQDNNNPDAPTNM